MSAGSDALGERLVADADALGVPLGAESAARLARYAELIARWNPRIRLVGPDDALTIVREQVVDALAFAHVLPHATSWWDVGSGAGLPGLVLAVLAPERRFVLVEPIAKKVAFLEHAATELGLANVAIVHGRVGEGGAAPALPARPSWARAEGAPHAALTRATFAPASWVPLAERLVGPAGIVVVAVAHEAELGASTSAATELARHTYRIPATGAPRLLVVLRAPAA